MKSEPSSQILTIWGFVLALTGILLYCVSKGQFIFAALVAAVIPVLTLARSPGKWWMARIFLASSGLMVPGTGSNIGAGMALSAGFIGLSIMELVFHRADTTPSGSPQRFALALAILLFGLASYRGWGLKFLGSSLWGGMQYLQLIIGLLFFYYSRQIKLSERQLRWAILGYLCMALLPVVLTFAVRRFPMFSPLEALIRLGDIRVAEDLSPETGTQRIQGLGGAARPLFMLALLLFGWRMKLSLNILGLVGAAFIFTGISGHRGPILEMMMMGFFYVVLCWKKIPKSLRIKGVMTAGVLAVMLYVSAPFLPLAYQRSLSVLPGIKVNVSASRDALQTSDWRIEMWRKMLPMIPKYALIGRGVGFDLREAYGAFTLSSDQTTKHEFFIATHNYHNGPLWAAIDLGGTGAILLFGFMIASIGRYGRRSRWSYSPFLGAVYPVVYSAVLVSFISFLGIYGDYQSVSHMALSVAILEVISKNGTPASSPIRGPRPARRRPQFGERSMGGDQDLEGSFPFRSGRVAINRRIGREDNV